MRDRRQHADASPMEKSLAECRSRGWRPVIVECAMSYGRKRDFDNWADIIGILPGGPCVGIQTTSKGHKADHWRKLTVDAAEAVWWWLQSGQRAELWLWGSYKKPSNGKYWVPQFLPISVDDLDQGFEPPDIQVELI